MGHVIVVLLQVGEVILTGVFGRIHGRHDFISDNDFEKTTIVMKLFIYNF